MTTRDRARRNRAIIEAKLRGETCREVAARYRLSVRQVRRIWRDGGEGPPDSERIGHELVRELLTRQDEQLERLADQLYDAPRVAILGLIKQESAIYRERIEILRLCGALDKVSPR